MRLKFKFLNVLQKPMHYQLDLWPIAVSGDHRVFMNQGLIEENEVTNRLHLNGVLAASPFLSSHCGQVPHYALWSHRSVSP